MSKSLYIVTITGHHLRVIFVGGKFLAANCNFLASELQMADKLRVAVSGTCHRYPEAGQPPTSIVNKSTEKITQCPNTNGPQYINIQSTSDSQPAFPFLQLPPEIRNMVYRFHLPNDRVTYRSMAASRLLQSLNRPLRRTEGFDILFTNKQIHKEALYLLCTEKTFVIEISSLSIDFLSSSPETSGLDLIVPNPDMYQSIRHIELHIDWSSYARLSCPPLSPQRSRISPVESLDDNMATVCQQLPRFQQLRSIDVTWTSSVFLITAFSTRILIRIPISEAKILVLLRPLKQIRRMFPGLPIRLPEDSPVSSSALAEQQEERCSYKAGVRVILEDADLRLEVLKDSLRRRMWWGLMS